LEPLDRDLARDTYLAAWMAALFAGRYADRCDLLEISQAARDLAPPGHTPVVADQLLDALAALIAIGPEAAAPSLRAISDLFLNFGVDPDAELCWGWFAQAAASATWDFQGWRTILARQVLIAGQAGALDQLPLMLSALGSVAAWSGDFTAAAAARARFDAVCEVTGTQVAPFIALHIAGLTGDAEQARPMIEATVTGARIHGQGIAEAFARWAGALLDNGLGRYAEALESALVAAADPLDPYIAPWALPEVVEAAVRTGDTETAGTALDRLARLARAVGSDEALGLEARSRALLSTGEAAESLYREAIERLGRTGLRPDLGRAHLLFGEWLRRENRRIEARAELRIAHESLADLGVAAFAERARRELLASGERARERAVETAGALTGQEALIARLARDGSTNPEIGAQLFISARTVEWHLRKVFTKLGIGSRRELAGAMARLGSLDDSRGTV